MSKFVILCNQPRHLDESEQIYFKENNIPIYRHRTEIPGGSLVIPRIFNSQHYAELECDVKNLGSKLLNDFYSHSFIAKFWYYRCISHLTFESYHSNDSAWMKMEGPYVVKGATNSRKLNFKELMYAETRRAAIDLVGRLGEDPVLFHQGLIIRKYHKLKTLQEGLNGLDFTNEFRFFCYRDQILSGAFYWEISDVDPMPPPPEARELVEKVYECVKGQVDYFVVDVAELDQPDPRLGKWAVVELNDGQMSGLSYNKPEDVYGNLSKLLP